MKRIIRLFSVGCALICALGFSESRAQNFDLSPFQDQLNTAVKPILGFFGSVAGGGFVNTAKLHNFGGFDVGARVVVSIIPDEFSSLTGDIPEQNISLGPFQDENALGFPFLTASMGLFGNFEAMARYFYFPLGDEPTRGGVTLVGGGLKYGLLQIPMGPKIVAVGSYQLLMVPDEFDFGTVKVASLKAFASQDLLLFTLYGGVGVDKTFLEVQIAEYNLAQSFEDTITHATVGLSATVFPLIRVNAEYNFGDFKSVTVGASFGIR